MLTWRTPAGWFAGATVNLEALLSDHLHCERKAAENCLHLVRRYAHRPELVERLGRLAHEETSHIVQVTSFIGERGLRVRADRPNLYARSLFELVRKLEPHRQVDMLLCAAFIEARSHERLSLLADGFAAAAEPELGAFYRALASAEGRHAEIFVELARPLVPAAEIDARVAALARSEGEILAALPPGSRVH